MTANVQFKSIIEQLSREHGFGAVSSFEQFAGGVVNSVFRVVGKNGTFVARLSKDSLETYRKEAWAMNQASQAGVCVPEVFGLGDLPETSFMVLEHIDRHSCVAEMTEGRTAALVELGRQAKLVNSIDVEGFGFFLNWNRPTPTFTQTWSSARTAEELFVFEDDDLLAMGALTVKEQARVMRFLQPMWSWYVEPKLCHGDLNLGNAIATTDGKVAMIDWTQAKGGIAPYYDLAVLSESNSADFQSVALGYGLTTEDFENDRQNYQRIALMDVLRAGAWANKVKHPDLHKFISDVRRAFESMSANL